MVCVVQTYDPPHPTYPLVRDITTGFDGSSTTSHAVSLPSGIGAGEGLLLLFGCREDGNTVPAGWTELYDFNAGTAGQLCAWREADGTEGASITVTSSASRRNSWQVWRFSRGNFIAGVTPEVGTPASGTSSTPDSPSLTPSWGAQNTFWIAAVTAKAEVPATTVSSWPSNYNDNQTTIAQDNVECISAASRTLNASSEDPGSFTMSASKSWVANIIALRLPAS